MSNEQPGPSQGQSAISFRKRPHDFGRFDELMDSLEAWRTADHEDAINLSRNEVIQIIEGVKALRG